ncbi:IS66 family insertion sequence element accessory protein TnpB [Chitinophaga sp. GbtcB8]|uniref:IS66 family insertion sequence element accessory protein TnpB n=1 Tax=Chitinophaga sp. GbtcB8 TaxID=2824753 RepID=UPI0021125418|nr:IS66 family insertion sequence element accessory protein TnpB [Chitinophaga sp. GbtcB8]
MLTLTTAGRYFLYRPATDMRKSFDSLTGIVRDQLQGNPMSTDVFIFLNRNRTHIKLLLWEGDGFALYYKRLEKGTYELPVFGQADNKACITQNQLLLMLQGISLKQVHYRKRYMQETASH